MKFILLVVSLVAVVSADDYVYRSPNPNTNLNAIYRTHGHLLDTLNTTKVELESTIHAALAQHTINLRHFINHVVSHVVSEK